MHREESNELAEKKRNHLCSLLGVAIPDATLASSPSRPVRPPTDFGYKGSFCLVLYSATGRCCDSHTPMSVDLVKEAGY